MQSSAAYPSGLKGPVAGDPASITSPHDEEHSQRYDKCQLRSHDIPVTQCDIIQGYVLYLQGVEVGEGASWHKVDHGGVVDTKLRAHYQTEGQRIVVHHSRNIATEREGTWPVRETEE